MQRSCGSERLARKISWRAFKAAEGRLGAGSDGAPNKHSGSKKRYKTSGERFGCEDIETGSAEAA